MLQTRIYPVTGFHVDVQETYQEVKNKITLSQYAHFIELTLENGDPVTFQRSQIVFFTKY